MLGTSSLALASLLALALATGGESLETVAISTPLVSGLKAAPSHTQDQVLLSTKPSSQPDSHKLIIGNWIAQWDTQYKAWFYYNIKTATSTWTKPPALSHVAFKSPSRKSGAETNHGNGRTAAGPHHHKGGTVDGKGRTSDGPHHQPQSLHQKLKGAEKVQGVGRQRQNQLTKRTRGAQKPRRTPYSDTMFSASSLSPAQAHQWGTVQNEVPKDRVLVSDVETGDFFGYDTNNLNSDRGLLGGAVDSFNGLYENVVKDYVTDVYTDVIEGYSIATIKLFGWFFVGSLLTLKGALLSAAVDTFGSRSLAGSSRSMARRSLRDEEGQAYTLPYVENMLGVRLSFPVEDLQDCYRERQTCTSRDLQGEVSHLVESAGAASQLWGDWLALTARMGELVTEEDYQYQL